MSEVKTIPFGGEQSGLDGFAGATPFFTNALMDKASVIRARPGLAAWSDFPAVPPSIRPVTMMQSFGDRLVYATDDGKLSPGRGRAPSWTSPSRAAPPCSTAPVAPWPR